MCVKNPFAQSFQCKRTNSAPAAYRNTGNAPVVIRQSAPPSSFATFMSNVFSFFFFVAIICCCCTLCTSFRSAQYGAGVPYGNVAYQPVPGAPGTQLAVAPVGYAVHDSSASSMLTGMMIGDMMSRSHQPATTVIYGGGGGGFGGGGGGGGEYFSADSGGGGSFFTSDDFDADS